MESFLNTSYTHQALALTDHGQILYKNTNKNHFLKFQAQAFLEFGSIKGLGTKKVEIRNQNAPKMPKKIKNSFLKRAQIPYDYNTGLQIKDFWCDF